MDKIALFDFDRTLVDIDSRPKFIRFIVKKKPKLISVLLWMYIWFLNRLKLISDNTRKILEIKMLKGYQLKEINEVLGTFMEILTRHENMEVVNRLHQHHDKGDRVIILSAGLDLYIRHYAQAKNVEYISTEVEVVDGILTGKYQQDENVGDRKISNLVNAVNLIDYDILESWAYSDNPELDQKMLELVGHRSLVKNGKLVEL